MCARGFAAACDSYDAETLGPRPGPGYVPRGRRLNPAGGREGRPYGDEGEEIPDPAGRSGTGPYGGEGKGMPDPAGRAAARAAPTGAKGKGCRVRRAGLGPAPTGERNKARRADTFRPRYRISVFRGGGYAPLPHQIPAFRRGGYHPPAALDTRPFVGAHSVRPRLRGCLRFLRRGNAGAADRAGVRPKGPQAVGTGRREKYTDPGGRPQGPPLRGRRGGNPGPGGPVWDRPLRGIRLWAGNVAAPGQIIQGHPVKIGNPNQGG